MLVHGIATNHATFAHRVNALPCSRVATKLIVNEINSSMIPSAIAAANSPFLVSSTIAVVNTLVFPAMFPPTMITAPTSVTTRPNAAANAITIETRASPSSANVAWARVAPRLLSCNRIPGLIDSIAERVRLAITGKAMMNCATTMAQGVKSQPSSPNGPCCDSIRNTISPTTTVGKGHP